MARGRPRRSLAKRAGWRIPGFILKVLFVLWAFTLIEVLVLRFIDPPFTVYSAWRRVLNLVSDEGVECRMHWKPLEEISPWLRKAVLAGEDQRFESHHGFDFIELDLAFREIVSGGRKRGASTISMQVARTVFLFPDGSWTRKAAEAYYTVLIELFWSKRRILEIYLNTVDWGGGLMGAEAASMTYFQTHAERLSCEQGALLAAILPNPHRWSPIRPDHFVRFRQKRIMQDMDKMPLI